jgi:nucleotide-binding universal stress UspA family protein
LSSANAYSFISKGLSMSGTIIVPTDFSTASEAALSFASELARSRGAKLLIVHVLEAPLARRDTDIFYADFGADDKFLETMLKKLQPTDSNVPYEHRLMTGEPVQTIVDLARDERADLIVMGSHGHRALCRMTLGSVATTVVRRAECPVLVVKQPPIVKSTPLQELPVEVATVAS